MLFRSGEEVTSLPPLRRLLKGSAEMWTDVQRQRQRQLQSQATLRLRDFARAVTNTLDGITATNIQALVTPNLHMRAHLSGRPPLRS